MPSTFASAFSHASRSLKNGLRTSNGPPKRLQIVRFLDPKWVCFRARQQLRNFMPKTPSNPCIAMTAQVHSVLLFTEYNWVRDVLRISILHALKHMKKSSKSYHFGPQLGLQKGFQISVPLGLAIFPLFNFSSTVLGLNLASKTPPKC